MIRIARVRIFNFEQSSINLFKLQQYNYNRKPNTTSNHYSNVDFQ
jgi:hypothetical protein